MLTYPFVTELDTNNTYLITFPDIPEAAAVVEAADIDNAAFLAIDGLLCALDLYVADRRPTPVPSELKDGQQGVTLPALETAKIQLSNEMVKQGVRKAELARRLEIHTPQVERLLNLNHNTQLVALEKAASKLGKKLSITLV